MLAPRHGILLPALALSFLAACGGGGGDDPAEDAGPTADAQTPDLSFTEDGGADAAVPPDMGGPIDTPADFRQAFVETTCAAFFDCPSRQTYAFSLYLGGYASAEECADSLLVSLLLTSALPGDEAVAAGRVTFDGEAAAECLQETRERLCDELALRPRDPACDRVFEGLREEGESCLSDECVEGQGCAGVAGECYGTCAPSAPSPCGACSDGQWCDSTSGTCQEPRTAGEACPFRTACAEGLFCDAPSSGLGTCLVPGSRAQGESCFDTPACDAGLLCDSSTERCVPYFVVSEGMACGDLPVAQACAPHLICYEPPGEDVGTCEPPRLEGETCADTIADCGVGLYCDGTTDECAPVEPFGSACTNSRECESVYCDDATNQCGPLPTCDLP